MQGDAHLLVDNEGSTRWPTSTDVLRNVICGRGMSPAACKSVFMTLQTTMLSLQACSNVSGVPLCREELAAEGQRT